MEFFSTRNVNEKVSAAQAIAQGLSQEGGLFVPASFPKVDLDAACKMEYAQLASHILSGYLEDYDPNFLKQATADTYGAAFGGKAGQLEHVEGSTYALELWHGPTCAFKDYALQLMPKLLVEAKKNLGRTEQTLILVATSGDTGKAALEGYKNIPGVKILVFYPDSGTSEIQRLQMVTQQGDNVGVYAVKGNFDDAQTGVKRVFADKQLAAELAKKDVRLSSANSINIGRLVPQIVYYVYAYAKLLESGEIKDGETINVTVPTGNFGNILAAYYAKQMGIPIGKLICASNDNKVLYDFFRTGEYDRNRPFILTTSPSMDILISSNLERLIYRIAGADASKDQELMKALSEQGKYEITDKMRAQLHDFCGYYASEDETAKKIAKVYGDTGYVLDPHTAVASCAYEKYVADTKDETKTVIASTASPYKFTRSVMEAIDKEKYGSMSDFDLVDELNKISGVDVPNAIEEIRTAPVRHKTVCDAADMEQTVKTFLGVE